MLVALITVAVEFVLKEPANIKNSPTKLPVPGKPIFDKVKNKKIALHLFLKKETYTFVKNCYEIKISN